jgi:phytoene/squalene synthetase
MLAFKVTEAQISCQIVDQNWKRLMQFEIDRTRRLMLSGAPLAMHLPGRIGWELRLVVHGGLRILEKIEAVEYDVFRRRPRLEKTDWAVILLRALRMRTVAAAT